MLQSLGRGLGEIIRNELITPILKSQDSIQS